MSSPPNQSSPYSQALDSVIRQGDQLIDWIDRDQQRRSTALNNFSKAVDSLGSSWPSPVDDLERPYLEAAANMRAGMLLAEAAHAQETSDATEFKRALAELKAEHTVLVDGDTYVLFFDNDLLHAAPQPATDKEALELFQARTARTLDNIVKEAAEVITAAWDKFRDKLDSFINELGDLAKSLSAGEGGGVFRKLVEKVISGLKTMAEYLKSDHLKEAIANIKQAAEGFTLENILAKAFGCDHSKAMVNAMKLGPGVDRDTLQTEGAAIAQISSRYVNLLNAARWTLKAVGLVGGLLLITGVAAHIAGLGMPIAYAVVAVATIIIGMNVARNEIGAILQKTGTIGAH